MTSGNVILTPVGLPPVKYGTSTLRIKCFCNGICDHVKGIIIRLKSKGYQVLLISKI